MSGNNHIASPEADDEAAARFRRLRWRTRRGLLLNRLLDSRASQGFLESELQALDQLLDLTDPVLLDLILERSQPKGDLDTPEIRALLTEIRAL